MIRDIVEFMGNTIAIDLVNHVGRIELQVFTKLHFIYTVYTRIMDNENLKGGMKRENDKIRRSPGGVFLKLLKDRNDLDQIKLHQILEKHSDGWYGSRKNKKIKNKSKNSTVNSTEAMDIENNEKSDEK